MNANGREWESFHHEDSKSTKERGGDWRLFLAREIVLFCDALARNSTVRRDEPAGAARGRCQLLGGRW